MESPSYDLAMPELYIGLIFIVFIGGLLLMTPMIMKTQRESTSGNGKLKGCKNFWHTIELIWLFLAFIAVVLSIPTAWPKASEAISDSFRAEAVTFLSQAHDAADQVLADHCGTNVSLESERICTFMTELKNFDDVSDYEKVRGLKEEYANLKYEFAPLKTEQEIYNRLWGAWEASWHAKYNLDFMSNIPNWMVIISVFWPHILAFAFALRISKAIAAYYL